MIRLILFMIIILSSSQMKNTNEIYMGKSFPWEVYYDSQRKHITIEIYGIKYGQHDHLIKNTYTQSDTIASSSVGDLYRKDGDLHYSNKKLNIDLKLKKKKFSEKIDNKRLKIYEIQAFNRISQLKDSLQIKDYQFDWDVKSDYEYFRDNPSLSLDHVPNYIKEFNKKVKE